MSAEEEHIEEQIEEEVIESESKVEQKGEAFDEQIDHPSNEFLEIFETLDPTINGELIEKAWKQFDTIGQQVILEGSQKAWMTCAFYTTVWQSTPLGQETICKYSVSKLLNICNLSVLEFFEKLNKWAEMIVASRRLLDHINRVQASLAVSTVVYKKFLPIFRRVFLNAERVRPSPPRAAKRDSNSLAHLTPANVFEFVWLMFIAFKKQFLASSDDLINSYHLLLCIIELVFEDVYHAKLNHLFNPEFAKAVNSAGESSVLEYLCANFDGVILDAKHFRAHWLFPRLRKLADDGLLTGSNTNGGMLASFAANKESLNALYEESMLKKAEIDERIFITSAMENIETVFNEALDASAIIILRRCNLDSNWAIDAELLLRMSTQNCIEKLNSQRSWQVPPSAKSYVITPEQFCPTTTTTTLSASAQKLQKLATLISIDFRQTDNDFDHLLAMSRENLRGFITDQIAVFNDRLERAVEQERTSKTATANESFSAQIKQRREDIELLFYRLLQQVVLHERHRSFNNGIEMANDPNIFFLSILKRVDFIGSLWIVALEIVLFCHDSSHQFPWSCNVASVAPVNFYKIIELVVRAEPDLSREMVKHLNKIEERVLEELAWSVDSPLWGALARYAEFGVPSCKAVSLTAAQGARESYANVSADAPTLVSRYNSSPMKPYERMPVKRRLDYDNYGEIIVHDEEGDIARGAPPHIKRPAISDELGEYHEYGSRGSLVLPSSVIVFFRKVYYLSAVRLTDLCDRIRVDEAGRQKVWTLFEYVLRNETTLMTGRHLDQNLMCCLYIIAKVCTLDTSFHDIMYHYRHQPQALSRVYRRVLIDSSISPATTAHLSDDGASRDSITSTSGGKLRSNSTLPTPEMASAPPTPEPHNADYADLIKYYNRVFVARVEEFVKRFNLNNVDSKENILMLIPMPKVHCNSLSPRRLVNDQINVLPLSSVTSIPGRPARYSFNRSPSKDLKQINAMVRGAQVMMPHGY